METIEFDGQQIPAAVACTNRHASDVTGQPISEFDVSFVVDEGQVSAASGTKGVRLEDGRRLKVNSSSYTVKGGREHWTLHTEEVEVLSPAAVIIGAHEVMPQQYAESVRDGQREIEIITLSDSETARSLYDTGESRQAIQVVRQGISPEPIAMEVDNIKYADEDGGYYVAIRLKSPEEDDSTEVPWTMDFFAASNVAAKGARARLRALTTLLEEKGVLTAEDVERLKADAEREFDEVGFEFNGLKRLSDCKLD